MIATVPHTITTGNIDVATRSRAWILNHQRECLLNTALNVAGRTIPCIHKIILFFFTTREKCRSRSLQSESNAGGNFHIVPPCFRHLCSAVPDSASLVPALPLSAISCSAPSGNSKRNSGRVNSRRHIGRRSHSDVEAPGEGRHAV